LLLPGPGAWITLIMILLITIGEVVSMPFMSSFWSMRSDESNRGQYAALYTISWGIGQTLGPFLCAMLADISGFKVLFFTLGSLLVITAAGFSRLNRRHDPPVAQPS
jgi:MFS family permease